MQCNFMRADTHWSYSPSYVEPTITQTHYWVRPTDFVSIIPMIWSHSPSYNVTTCDSNIHRTEYGPLALGDLAATREKGIASKRQVLSDWAARWDLLCPAQPRHNDGLALWWQFWARNFLKERRRRRFLGSFSDGRWPRWSCVGGSWKTSQVLHNAHWPPRSTCFTYLLQKDGGVSNWNAEATSLERLLPEVAITWDEWLLLNFPSFQIILIFLLLYLRWSPEDMRDAKLWKLLEGQGNKRTWLIGGWDFNLNHLLSARSP